MMGFIKKETLKSVAVEFEEDIEEIRIYPQKQEIKVITYKRFYDSDGKVVRTEAGTTEEIKNKDEIDSIAEKLILIIQKKRK